MERPKELDVHEVAQALRSPNPPRLVDVRGPDEWEVVHLEAGVLLTESLLDEIVRDWPRETPIVCYCHHGVRSLNAAMYLRQQGFTEVSSMRGGIDAWSCEVDPSLPRY